jgi:heme oxygenase (mycobilin-producing)
VDGDAGPVVLINLFEVPENADDGFITGWERARDFLSEQDGYLSTGLHRSLDRGAEFRFVNVAHWRSAEAFKAATAQPDFPGRDLPFPSHPGLYEVVRQDQPPADDPGGVVLINPFEVPADGDEAFLAGWEQAWEFLRTQPGYLATRLHRSLAADAEFRFVNLGRYQSPEVFRTATEQPGFRQAAAAIPFRAHPGLYDVVFSDAERGGVGG